jgi:hypothetical protein
MTVAGVAEFLFLNLIFEGAVRFSHSHLGTRWLGRGHTCAYEVEVRQKKATTRKECKNVKRQEEVRSMGIRHKRQDKSISTNDDYYHHHNTIYIRLLLSSSSSSLFDDQYKVEVVEIAVLHESLSVTVLLFYFYLSRLSSSRRRKPNDQS